MKRKTFLGTLTFLPVLASRGEDGIPIVKESCKTQKDAEGPYYKKGAPTRAMIEDHGSPLLIKGRVLNASDCSTPIANATIDIWHCDSNGEYDNDGFKCRGVVNANGNGEFSFTTIFPPAYGSRPRHIHFKVRAKGFPELTSQIYFKGDERIQNDFARNAEPARIIAVNKNGDRLSGLFDIYL